MGQTRKVKKYFDEVTTPEERSKIEEALKNADRFADNDALVSLDQNKLEEANSLVSDEAFEEIEETMNALFAGDEKFRADFASSEGKQIYTLSAKNLDYALNNVTVVKNGYERPYKEVYGLMGKEINEENKKIIAAQFVNNITSGDLAKGYLSGNIQFKLYGKGTPSYGKNPETNIEPANMKLLDSNQMVEEIQEPQPISWYQRVLARVQKAFNYDGATRRAVEKFNKDSANYNAYKAAKDNNENNLGTEYEDKAAASEAKYKAERAKEDYEKKWLEEKNNLDVALTSIRPGLTSKVFIENTFKKYEELKKGINDLPNKDYGKTKFKITEERFKNKQKQLNENNRVKMSKDEKDELLNEGKKDVSKTGKVNTKTVSKDKSFE